MVILFVKHLQKLGLSPFSILFLPSTVNGKVTTATVNAFNDFEISATTGAEPVPVPPPKPQVMKTRSDWDNVPRSSSADSFAADSPI